MNKKPTNSIDDVFRNSIENLETPPSESFWIKTSEEALFKSNLADRKAIGKWKMVAAALAVILISLSGYVIYMQKEINRLNGKVNVINKEIVSQPVTRNNISTPNHAQLSNGLAIVNKESSYKAENHKTRSNIQNQNILNSSAGYINKNSSTKDGLLAMNGKTRKNSRFSSPNNYNKSSGTIKNNTSDPLTSFVKNINTDGSSNYDNQSLALNSVSNLYLPTVNNVEAPLMENMLISEDNSLKKQSLLSKLSVSVFYEPYLSDELFENDATDVTTINSVVSSEEEMKPYIIGMRAEYKLSTHLSVLTGLLFYNFKVSVDPTTIFAQKMPNGDIGYAFHTSIGTVSCPYSAGTNTYIGDALTVKGAYTSNYVSVPVYVKYNFFRSNNWDFYVTGGLNINIVTYRKMDMHWQDSRWDQGDAIEGIAGSSNLYSSLYVSPGVSYILYKGLSVYVEPSLQSSPIFISRSGVSKTNPLFTGIAVGLTYQL